MIRARFYIKKSDCGNDYRPVKWPIKYPYWCSGESDDSFILVAYAEDEDSIKELWPEAYDINVLEKDTEVKFTLRFPKPKWYELQEERLEEYDKLYGKFVWVTDMCLKDGKIRKVKARIEDCGGLLLADTPGRYTPYQIGDCAFEPLKKQESYLGKRKKRGLFQSSVGKLINADINGAIGIARKVVGDSFIGKIIDSGFVFNPVRINIL